MHDIIVASKLEEARKFDAIYKMYGSFGLPWLVLYVALEYFDNVIDWRIRNPLFV